MQNIEIVQQHKIRDVYRITDGVLIKVNKFKQNERDGWYWSTTQKYKNQMEKVDGIKNCFKLKEDCVRPYWTPLGDGVSNSPAGTIIFEDCPIEILDISQKEEWFYELKTTGQAFSGDYGEFEMLLDKVKKILDSY